MGVALADQLTYLLRAAVLRSMRCGPDEWPRRAFAVLVALAERSASSQQELADLLCINRTVMVGVVDRLEAESLVERARDPRDRRRYALRITPQGEAQWRALEPDVDRGEACLTEPLADPERARLIDLLQQLASDSRLPAPIADRLGYLVIQAHQRALQGTLAALAPFGLFPRQYGALGAVNETPGCSQLQIATTFGVSEPVVAEVASELVQRGLLLRLSDPRDRRAYQLTLTEAGRDLLQRARSAVIEQEAALITPFAADEASVLRRLLRRLLDAPAS